jgi:hypothetical protein
MAWTPPCFFLRLLCRQQLQQLEVACPASGTVTVLLLLVVVVVAVVVVVRVAVAVAWRVAVVIVVVVGVVQRVQRQLAAVRLSAAPQNGLAQI